MSLRIGFDMDGTLADFAAAYHDVEERLYGRVRESRADDPEVEAGKQDDQEDDARERRMSQARGRTSERSSIPSE